MSVTKNNHELNVLLLKHNSHLSRARMQELANFGEVKDGIAENIYDDIDALNLSQLVYRPSMNCLLHLFLKLFV